MRITGEHRRQAMLDVPLDAPRFLAVMDALPGLREAWEASHIAVRRKLRASQFWLSDVKAVAAELALGSNEIEPPEAVEAAWLAAMRPAEDVQSGDDWRIGGTFRAGDLIWDLGDPDLGIPPSGPYRVLQTHTAHAANWRPALTPALFALVQGEWAPWVQPQGAHDAYQTGDRVTYEGRRWESAVDANVWPPGVVAGHWIDKGSADG